MSKLSELVTFRNRLRDLKPHLYLTDVIEEKVRSVENTLLELNVPYQGEVVRITSQFAELASANEKIINSVDSVINNLNNQIDGLANAQFTSAAYQEMFNGVTTQKTSIILELDSNITHLVDTQIRDYADWHYPGLYIQCNNKAWADCMVANDPLYLTHTDLSAVQELIKGYEVQYQHRLRCYETPGFNFSKLPQGQFGFIFSWDLFTFLNIVTTEKLLTQTFNLLRPGGTFMFNYNNCDLPESMVFAEEQVLSYNHARLIKKMCNSIGYEVTEFKDYSNNNPFYKNVSWVELRKPGALFTRRSHQVLGRIIT